MKNLTNKVYVSATTSFTLSDIKTRYLTKDSQGNQFYAYSKQDNVQGGFVDTRLHYSNVFKNGMTLTPFIGVNYSKNAIPGFSQADSSGIPFTVSSLKNERTNIMTGASLTLPSCRVSKFEIIPTINTTVDHQVHGKVDSIKMTDSSGNVTTIKTEDSHKTTVSLGGSLGVAYKKADLLVAYDAQVGKKFFGQQVSLKIRYNF